MKRLAVVLIVVVISMLTVVASASATTVLTGKYTGGVAVRESGGPAPSAMMLAPSGAVNIVIGALQEVNGVLRVTAPGDPEEGPFPFTVVLPRFFTWTSHAWNGTTYVATGTVGGGTSREDPRFDVTLTAGHGVFDMRIDITNSYYYWDYWDFWGVLL